MIRRASAAIGLALAAASPAVAQQNQPLFATGPLTPGHILVLQQAGTPGSAVTRDAGPALAGNITELGITNDGLPLCVRDKAQQHLLCFGANALGGGLISFNPVGSGTPTSLNFNINGATYPFPGSGTGTGNVVGPNASQVGELASFNNTVGSLLRQGAAQITDNQTGPLTTAGATFSANTNGNLITAGQIQFWAGFSQNIYDAVRGTGVLTSGSTVGLVNGVGGYAVSSAVTGAGGFPTAGAVFGIGLADVNNSRVWGLNTLVTDNRGQSVSSGTGKELNNELDFNVTSPNTSVIGLVLQGASLAQPAIANGFNLGPLALAPYLAGDYSKQWSAGFISDDNVTTVGLYLGIGGPARVANQPSQFIWQAYNDSSNVRHTSQIQTHPIANAGGGNAAVYVTAEAGQIMNVGVDHGGFFTQDSVGVTNGLVLGKQAVSGNNVASQLLLWSYNDGAGASQAYFAQATAAQSLKFTSIAGAGVGVFEFDGNLMLPTIATTGHVANGSLCIDVGGNVFEKTTTGPCL